MNELNELMKFEGQSTGKMSSREIAELTGKLHKDVLRDIRKLSLQLVENQYERSFALVKYKDTKGELRPEYLLDKEQSILLISGYDAMLRLKIIRRWAELEAKQQPSYMIENPIERARAWALEMEGVQKAIETTNKLLTNNLCYDISVVAKECGFKSAQEFNSMLTNDGYIFKQNGFWKEYADKVYLKFFRHGSLVRNGKTLQVLQITEKGRIHFVNEYKN